MCSSPLAPGAAFAIVFLTVFLNKNLPFGERIGKSSSAFAGIRLQSCQTRAAPAHGSRPMTRIVDHKVRRFDLLVVGIGPAMRARHFRARGLF